MKNMLQVLKRMKEVSEHVKGKVTLRSKSETDAPSEGVRGWMGGPAAGEMVVQVVFAGGRAARAHHGTIFRPA